MFEDKFKNLQDADPNLKEDNCLEVYDLKEVCAKYQVEHKMSRFQVQGFLKNKVDIINDLCKKLQGNMPIYVLQNLKISLREHPFSVSKKLKKTRRVSLVSFIQIPNFSDAKQ